MYKAEDRLLKRVTKKWKHYITYYSGLDQISTLYSDNKTKIGASNILKKNKLFIIQYTYLYMRLLN